MEAKIIPNLKIRGELKGNTEEQYKRIIQNCKDLFRKKTKDYGTAWRVLRLSSITDQILIKARRIRSIQEKGSQQVEDAISDEFIGIINYCLIALIQIELEANGEDREELSFHELEPLFDRFAVETMQLLSSKNHDYDEAWREMRISSITDIILMKLHRVKQIEDNEGKTLASEGVGANYQDIINYSIFSLIKIEENELAENS